MTAIPYTEKPAADKAGPDHVENSPSHTQNDVFMTPAGQPPAYSGEPQPKSEPVQDSPARPTLRQRLSRMAIATGRPVNKLTNIVGAEGWWPTSMDDECLKAARILHSFTKLDSSSRPANDNGPKHPTGLTRKSMVKIPPGVLQGCAGLAIFNTARLAAGHGSLAGGSGVVIARRGDGTWSPPSAFLVSTVGAGFIFGLDVYDCVCVLNTPAQVAAFTSPQLALGGNFGVSLGPVGGGSAVSAAVNRPGRPAWTYIKSRGLWAGLQVDGTVIVSRPETNALFYQERGITAQRILQGDVAWPAGSRPLFEVLMALEAGRGQLAAAVPAVLESNSGGGDVAPVAAAREVPPFVDEKKQVGVTGVTVPAHDAREEEPVPAYSEKDEELYASSAADEKERLAKADQKSTQ